jgi:hypothetical protein
VSTPQEFGAQIRAEIERWGNVIRAANIKRGGLKARAADLFDQVQPASRPLFRRGAVAPSRPRLRTNQRFGRNAPLVVELPCHAHGQATLA